MPTRLEHYLRYRRRYEIVAWVLFLMLNLLINVHVVWSDLSRAGLAFERWQVLSWEASSTLLIGALIPFLLAVERRYPLDRRPLIQTLLMHLGASVAFSVAHVLGMVALRKLIYALNGLHYDFGDWPRELFYEYLKDVRTWAELLAIVYLYRFVLRRAQGEAKSVRSGEQVSAPADPDHFLVKKLGREFLIRSADIHWVEAAGNYVTLHCTAGHYMLRETMQAISKRLRPHGFVRVHRSAVVKLDSVDHLQPLENGEAQAHLVSGATVPVSRRYRKALKEQLGSG